MSVVVTAEYKTFLKEIKERIYKAQYDAFKAVNKVDTILNYIEINMKAIKYFDYKKVARDMKMPASICYIEEGGFFDE